MKAQIFEDIKSKICKGCGKELSLNNFWKQPNNKDGYFGKCKVCALTVVDNTRLLKQPFLEKNIWICPSCKEELLLNTENFHADISTLSGFRNRCKKCVKVDRMSFNRMINKDSLHYFLKEVINGARSRAIKKGLEFNISLEFLENLWNNQKGKCALTGISMTHTILSGRINTNLSIDRIDSNKGYIIDNVQFVCIAANIIKSDMSIEELKYFCKLILQYHE